MYKCLKFSREPGLEIIHFGVLTVYVIFKATQLNLITQIMRRERREQRTDIY